MRTIPVRVGDKDYHIPVVENGTTVEVDQVGLRRIVRRMVEQDMRVAIDEREREYREARHTVKEIDRERLWKVAEAREPYLRAKKEADEKIEAFRHNTMKALGAKRSIADGAVETINREYNVKITAAEAQLAPALTQKDADIEQIRKDAEEQIARDSRDAIEAATTALAALTMAAAEREKQTVVTGAPLVPPPATPNP